MIVIQLEDLTWLNVAAIERALPLPGDKPRMEVTFIGIAKRHVYEGTDAQKLQGALKMVNEMNFPKQQSNLVMAKPMGVT